MGDRPLESDGLRRRAEVLTRSREALAKIPVLASIVLALTVGTAPRAVAADCSLTPIAIGQSARGRLTAGDCVSSVFRAGGTHFADRWSFDGTVGQQVAILISSGDYTPSVALIRASDGVTLQSVNGSGTAARLPGGAKVVPSCDKPGLTARRIRP